MAADNGDAPMEVLLHVTCGDALPVALPLARACGRAGISWGCFLSGAGVTLLGDAAFVSALGAATRAVACDHSWERHMGGACPIGLGSQLDDSTMMGEAVRVVSL